MEMLFIVVAVIGIPLDWFLGKIGYPDVFKSKHDNLVVMAMARSFRCGVITLVLFIFMLLTIGLIWSN